MSVKYAGGGGGGFWDAILGLASVAIPGAAPYVAAVNLARGKPQQAIQQGVKAATGGKSIFGGGDAPVPPNTEVTPDDTSRWDNVMNGMYQSNNGPWNSNMMGRRWF